MRRAGVLLLAGLLMLSSSGCRRYAGMLPYAREIEDMQLMQTLGVDGDGEQGVAVTASSGQWDGQAAQVVSGEAGTISAAVLSMQAEGSSYLYFGHVGQLLLGEELAGRWAGECLDYVLRDVETRLDTALYLVQGGTARQAIEAAAQDGSAAGRLEAMAQDAGLLAWSMPRTVNEVLSDLTEQGASFAPAIQADSSLTAVGYGILKDGKLVGWAEGEAALGINLLQSRMDADVVELPLPDGGTAALRVVGARTSVRPVCENGTLTGLRVECRVDANLAEGQANLEERSLHAALEKALEERESQRIRAALELAWQLDADYLGLLRTAALVRPWLKDQLTGRDTLDGLSWEVSVTADLQRSYEAR